MFKFNFNRETDSSILEVPEVSANIDWFQCSELEVTPEMIEKLKDIDEEKVLELKYCDELTIKSLSPIIVMRNIKKNAEQFALSDLVKADESHSDLIPGKYEGGLKIWECTRDLVSYLAEKPNFTFNGKNVLDLGCGTGILGIMALLRGASVTFQDYNKEVLELITIPNVYLNTKRTEAYEKAKFYFGDWASFLDKIISLEGDKEDSTEPSCKRSRSDCKYDYILSSETIYNPSNYKKIHNTIKELMQKNGTCYLSAKSCYFGVGGNIHSFTEFIKREGVFNYKTCWSSNDGVLREILELTFINESSVKS